MISLDFFKRRLFWVGPHLLNRSSLPCTHPFSLQNNSGENIFNSSQCIQRVAKEMAGMDDEDGDSADYVGVHDDDDDERDSSPLRSSSPPPPLPSRLTPTPPALKLFISPTEAAATGASVSEESDNVHDSRQQPNQMGQLLQQRLQQQRSSSTDSSDSLFAEKTAASSYSSPPSPLSKTSPIPSYATMKVESNANLASLSSPSKPAPSSSTGSSKLVANMLSQPAMSHPNDAFLQLLRLQQGDSGGDGGSEKALCSDEKPDRVRETASIIGSVVDANRNENEPSQIHHNYAKAVLPATGENSISSSNVLSSVTMSTNQRSTAFSISSPKNCSSLSIQRISGLHSVTSATTTTTTTTMSTGVKTIPATLVLKREVAPSAHASFSVPKAARLVSSSGKDHGNSIDQRSGTNGDGSKAFDGNHSYATGSQQQRFLVNKSDEATPSPHHLSHLSLQRSQQQSEQQQSPPSSLPPPKSQSDNSSLTLRDNSKMNENQHSILIFSAGPSLQSAYPTSSCPSSSIQQRQLLLHHPQQQCQKYVNPGSSLQRLNPSTLQSFATTSNGAASSTPLISVPSSLSSSIAPIPSSSSLHSTSVILPALKSDSSTNVDSVPIASIMAGQQQLQQRHFLLPENCAIETAADVGGGIPAGKVTAGAVPINYRSGGILAGSSDLDGHGVVRSGTRVVGGAATGDGVIGSNNAALAQSGGVVSGGGGVVASTSGASGEIQLLLLPSITFVQSADGKLIPTISSQPLPPQPPQQQQHQSPQPSPNAISDFHRLNNHVSHTNVAISNDVFLPAQHQQQYQQQTINQKPMIDVSGGIPPRHFLATTADGQRIIVSADSLPPSHPILAAQEQQQQQQAQLSDLPLPSFTVTPSTDNSANSTKGQGGFYATGDQFSPPQNTSEGALQAHSQSTTSSFPSQLPPAPPLPLSTERTIAENISLLYAQLCKYPLEHVAEIRASQLKRNIAPNKKIFSLEPKFVILKHQEFMEEVLHSVVQFAKGIPGGTNVICATTFLSRQNFISRRL